MSLLLLAKLLLLAFGCWSLLMYSVRRSNDKARLKELQSSHQTVRSLTSEELAALQPLLGMPPTPGKPLELQNHDVVRLHGSATEHSVSIQGNTSRHCLIGGVEVLLPYDAIDHLQPLNDAEVVIADRCAIVIRLNESFDLLQAREHARLKQLADHRWTQGMSAEPQDNAPPCESELRVLRQRVESSFELAARASKVRWGQAFALLVGGLCALFVSDAESPTWRWVLWSIAGACSLTVLRGFITQRQPLEPGKVNSAQGSLMQVNVAVTANGVTAQRYVLGSTQVVNFPHHWLPFVQLGTARTEMDVRLDDQQVVRYRHLSIDEEQRRFPRVLWGHHLLLTSVGVVLALATWIVTDDLRSDVLTLQAWSAPTISRNEALTEGRRVDFSASVQCGLGRSIEQAVDCSQLQLGAKASAITLPAPKAHLVKWAQGTGFDIMTYARGHNTWMLGSDGIPVLSTLPVVIRDVASLADDIDTLCTGVQDAYAAQSCSQLKMDLIASMQTETNASPDLADWASARAWLKAQSASKTEVYAVIADRELQEWTTRAKGIANSQLHAHVMALLDDVSLRQRSGASLKLLHVSPTPDGQTPPTDGLQAWQALQRWANTPDSHQVKVQGVVTGQHQENGQIQWVIDGSLNPDEAWRSAMRCALMLGAVSLLIYHLVALCVALRRDQQRLDAIIAHWTRLSGVTLGESSGVAEPWPKAS